MAPKPTIPLPYSHRLRPADLASRKPTRFALAPEGAALAALARDVGATSLQKVSFRGELTPKGRGDWLLTAELGATAEQPCIVTLAPVRTRIDEKIRRSYLVDWQEPEGDEVEMPEDDSTEPLPAVIDLGVVLAEALALALPLYPRADGAELGEAVFAAPGTEPLTADKVRPFAGLAGLKAKLEDDGKAG